VFESADFGRKFPDYVSSQVKKPEQTEFFDSGRNFLDLIAAHEEIAQT
jgi:hypothetical protein